MLVTELIRRLSHGPLSNLSMANEGDGTIKPSKLPSIIDHTNEGLLKLFSRFNLSEKELILQLQEGQTSYRLIAKYAESRQDEYPDVTPYILDEFDPFMDDLIQVLRVNRTGGATLPLNNDGVPNSLYTPMVNVLQVPVVWPGVPLFVTYQAKHVPLVLDDAQPNSTTEIDLPSVLEEALLSYVAHKVFFHMNGQEHSVKAGEHLAMFNASCEEVTMKDLVNESQSHTTMKFHDRGFV